MQIVINIDDDVLLDIQRVGLLRLPDEKLKIVDSSIQLGTPLPKGHGRLIDADEINLKDISPVDGFSVYGATAEDIDLTPTVLEADEVEE